MISTGHLPTRGALWLGFVLLLPAGCAVESGEVTGADDQAPAARAHDLPAGEWFTDEAAASGLDFVHFNGATGRFHYPELLPPGVGSSTTTTTAIQTSISSRGGCSTRV